MSKFTGYQFSECNPNGNITVEFNNSEKKVVININSYSQYLKKSNKHYVDTKNGSLVMIDDMIVIRKVFIIDGDTIYKRADQWEYDKFENDNFPDSDNSKLYLYLLNYYHN